MSVKRRLLGIGVTLAERMAKQTYNRSQKYVPIDTGALKRSGRVNRAGARGWQVTYGLRSVVNPKSKTPTSQYAGPVEFGHPRMASAVKRHVVKSHHRILKGRGQSVRRHWVKRYTRQMPAVRGRYYLTRAYEETQADVARFTRDAAGKFARGGG